MSWTNGQHFARWARLAKSRRVSMAWCGDSNCRNYNGGYLRGFEQALQGIGVDPFATAFLRDYEYQQVAGVGDNTRYLSQGIYGASTSAPWANTGATSYNGIQLAQCCLAAAGSGDQLYKYLATTNEDTTESMGTIRTFTTDFLPGTAGRVGGWPLGLSTLKIRHWIGEFTTSGGSYWARTTNPTASLTFTVGGANVSAVSVSGTDGTIVEYEYDVPTLEADADSQLSYAWNAAAKVVGNFVTIGWYIEDTSRTTGYQIGSLYTAGGTTTATGWDPTTGLLDTGVSGSTAFYNHQFDTLTRAQGGAVADRVLCIPITFGMNDKGAVTDTAYRNNIINAVGTLQAAWATWGGTASNLVILLLSSHPHQDNYAQQAGFYTICDEVAGLFSNVSSFNINAFADHTAFDANGWYNGNDADSAHLSVTGYRAIADAILADQSNTGATAGKLIAMNII